MPANTDPFSKVLVALWSLLESREGFTNLVKPGNRVKFHETENPKIKEKVRSADLPEVRIVADALDPHLFRTSNGSSFNRIYRIEIYTGDYRVTAQAFPVEWEILKAIAVAGDRLLESYPGGDPIEEVKQFKPITGEIPGADGSGRTQGWHTVIAVEVSLWYRTATLQA